MRSSSKRLSVAATTGDGFTTGIDTGGGETTATGGACICATLISSEGLGIAFLLLSISIVVSGTFIYIYSTQVEPNLLADIWTKAQEEMEKSGQQESADFALGFAKKFFWAIYFAGRFIGALITSLIVSIFTQKKNPEPFS